jgi:hypothetical protein
MTTPTTTMQQARQITTLLMNRATKTSRTVWLIALKGEIKIEARRTNKRYLWITQVVMFDGKRQG